MGWKIICTIKKSPYILKEDSFCSCYSFKIMAFCSYYVAAYIIFFMLASGCFPSAFFSTCYLQWSVLVIIMLSFGWRTVAQFGHTPDIIKILLLTSLIQFNFFIPVLWMRKKGKISSSYTSSLCPAIRGFYSPCHRSLIENIQICDLWPAQRYF